MLGTITRDRIAAAATAAAVYLAIAVIGFALRRPSYSHARNTISELGESGAADSALVSYGVFLLVGLAMAALSAWFAWRDREAAHGMAAAMLAGCVAAGYVVAAFFPCDPGSPASGSDRQRIHNLGGAVEYIGGAIALFWMGRIARRGPNQRLSQFYLLGAVATAGAVVGLSLPALAGLRGLIQRVVELWLFVSIIIAARGRDL